MLALIRGWQTSTLLIKNGEISIADINAIKGFCGQRSFDLAYYPGMPAHEANLYNQLEASYFYDGTRALLGVSVQIFDQSSQPITDPYLNNKAFSYDAPEVSSVTPNHCATVGGCAVTITGNNFGAEMRGHNNDKPLAVTIAGRPCVFTAVMEGEPGSHGGLFPEQGDVGKIKRGGHMVAPSPFEGNHSEWLTHHELRCIVPEGLGLQNMITVSVDGIVSSPVPLFNYHAPVVLSVEPNHGPPKYTGRLVIRGYNFGTSFPGNATVSDRKEPTAAWVGGVPCRVHEPTRASPHASMGAVRRSR